MLTILPGNIFTSEARTLVNTVNCVGVMGAGIALEFKLRYPAMFQEYQRRCRAEETRIGRLWLYHDPGGRPSVLNFPTKKHWRDPSRIEYLEQGLREFVESWRDLELTSVAFPILGAQHGGLPEDEVIGLMAKRLYRCDLDIEIYLYDPAAKDELIDGFRERFARKSAPTLAHEIGIRPHQASALRDALPRANTLGQLAAARGVGEKTLALAFASMKDARVGQLPF